MKKGSLYVLVMCLSVGTARAQQTDICYKYVDPMVGTANSTTPSALKHGEGGEQLANTIPAVGLPFGMTQWTAQTRLTEQKCIPPYLYKDSLITGFRGTHWLSGSCTQDYGSVTIMPITGSLQTDPLMYGALFSRSGESASPGYYSVQFPLYHLNTEITATARCGMLQFSCGQDDSLYLLIKPNSDKGHGFVWFDRSRNEVVGYNPAYRIYQGAGKPAGFSGYFVVQLMRGMPEGGTFSNAGLHSLDSISNQAGIGVYVGCRVRKGEQILVRIGTSFTSIEEARKNLAAEMPGWDFTAIRKAGERVWDTALSRIEVEGAEKDKRIFYTALYHTMQLPRLFNDVDGSYPEFAHQYTTAVCKPGTNYYDDFSMWDIYRAELPLYEILDPSLINDLAGSVISKGRQGGWIPIFPCWNSYTNEMVGDHGTAFIASAWLKHIDHFDQQEAYRLMRQNAFDTASPGDYRDGKGRRALTSYTRFGYIPLEDPVKEAFHQNEQVSRTLEYAYDDYALAMVAKAIGRLDDYQVLLERSRNYRNVFDTSIGLVRGRHADGSWITPFNADKRASYITEGTSRQYTFYAPQDVPGLAVLMGGKDKLEAALDSLFALGEYWHGNEPGHQIPFMYNFTNAAWKTQREVRRILKEEYSDGPGGLCGNDDAGQISAWYVFAAMGLYPLDPVSGKYQLCSPIFDRVRIWLPHGKNFSIITHKKTPESIFIRSVLLRGKPLPGYELSHEDLIKGGQLDVELTTP